MGTELLGGAFLGAALQVSFRRLASSEITSYFQSRKIKDTLLKKLCAVLISINQVLDDAEGKQYSNPKVKKWLGELKHAVYLTDDLLDEIATEATRVRIEAENQSTMGKVFGFFTVFVSPFDKQIDSRIQQVLDKLEPLAKQKKALGLKESSGGTVLTPASSQVADEHRIHGRDGEKEKIVDLLLDDELSNNQLSVISIVGMGGVGKTTLSQLVYDNSRVENEFQIKVWVCVSEEIDVLRITRTILSALECSITGHEGLNQLQLKLKDKLMGKKFLLVLDDFANENQPNWEAMQVPLSYGSLGSKILVTTRNAKVASVMNSIRILHLPLLSKEDGWQLFAEHAFKNKDASAHANLELIGKRIVEKCKGLPLALKTLGGLLHTKLSEKHWNEVLDSELWKLPDDETNINPALRLSYHYLPSNSKRCFAFCSVFPKDHEIDKDSLIEMWMAEDLLHFQQGNTCVEEIGNEILEELESRSFLQKSRIDDNNLIMHDLVSDLAKSISEGFCLRIQGGSKVQNTCDRIRYCSYSSLVLSNEMLLEPIYNCAQLHCLLQLAPSTTFIMEGKDEGEILSGFMNLHILSLNGLRSIAKLIDSISQLKHLRYLDLSRNRITKLPDSFCTLYNLQTLKLSSCFALVELSLDLFKLINLHYLDLSHTQISKLPDSICKLVSLQTLKLQGCQCLAELPPDFHNLINLHHLDLIWTSIREMPMNMGKLKHLQILTDFYVGRYGGSNISELGKLSNLQGGIEISQLENVYDPVDAREANLRDLKYLSKLRLQWSGNNEDSQNERSVLEALQPHANLEKLSIRNYGGTRFADWFDSPFLPNLVYLVLRACKYCFCLPPLGQLPSLKSLEINALHGIKMIGSEFYGDNSSVVPFPSLEYLKFEIMVEWEEWEDFEGECFPCLKEIYLRSCPRLKKSLPTHLPCLEKLQIDGCEDLEIESFPMKDFSCPKLESISLSATILLKSLHEDMHTLLPSLRHLSLSHCPQLQLVPETSLPLSLVGISIHGCPNLIASRMSWGLHRLSSLKEFVVSDDFENVESFPEEELLPTGLTFLELWGCSNLTQINSDGLRSLTSLKCLRICHCPNLQCLPEEGLPSSLSQLEILGSCPLLKRRYQKENGEYWLKISHIPRVYIK